MSCLLIARRLVFVASTLWRWPQTFLFCENSQNKGTRGKVVAKFSPAFLKYPSHCRLYTPIHWEVIFIMNLNTCRSQGVGGRPRRMVFSFFSLCQTPGRGPIWSTFQCISEFSNNEGLSLLLKGGVSSRSHVTSCCFPSVATWHEIIPQLYKWAFQFHFSETQKFLCKDEELFLALLQH